MERKTMAGHTKKGLKIKARLGFSDESAFSDKPLVGKTWAPQGRTPVLKTPGGWMTRSVISLITRSPLGKWPRLCFQTMRGAVNAERFIQFLKPAKRHGNSGKLILIIDNLRVHKATMTQEYVRARKHWLTVEFLPPYAPELNPPEYLWSSRKRKHFSNASIQGGKALDQRIRKSGRDAEKDAGLLKGFLRASSLFVYE